MPEITLLVHNIRSTYNVGAIMRTAEGFGVRQIIFSGYTPYPDLRLADPQSIDPRLPAHYRKVNRPDSQDCTGRRNNAAL